MMYLTFIIILSTHLTVAEVTNAATEESFVCDPQFPGLTNEDKAQILKRMDKKNCITPLDNSIEYKKEHVLPITNGKLFILSAADSGHTSTTINLQLAHQCNGKKKTPFKKIKTLFCGYQNPEVDRTSPFALEIRNQFKNANYNRDRSLTEKDIDTLVAREINAWISDPVKNITEENGIVSVKILEKSTGTTCYSSKTLNTYTTDCIK